MAALPQSVTRPFTDPFYKLIRYQIFGSELKNILTTKTLCDWQAFCTEFAKRKHLYMPIDHLVNAWTPSHPETKRFKAEWKGLLDELQHPEQDHLDSAIAKITRMKFFHEAHTKEELESLYGTAETLVLSDPLSPFLTGPVITELSETEDSFDGINNLAPDQFPFLEAYLKMSDGIPELEALAQYCQKMNDPKAAANLFAITVILSTQQIPEAKFQFNQYCHLRKHLFLFQPEDLMNLIAMAKTNPSWERSDLSRILRNPEKGVGSLINHPIYAEQKNDQNQRLLYLILAESVPNSLSKPETVRSISTALQALLHPAANPAFHDGKLLQRYLDFLKNLPPQEDETSLKGLRRAFFLSCDLIYGPGHFNRMFSFLESRPDILNTRVMIQALIDALYASAQESHSENPTGETQVFQRLKDFSLTPSETTQNSFFTQQFHDMLNGLERALGKGPSNKDRLNYAKILLEPLFFDILASQEEASKTQ